MSAPHRTLFVISRREKEAHRFFNLAGILSVVNSPLKALNDAGIAAGAIVTEHLDSDEGTLFGNTVLCSSDGPGNVGSVAKLIRV